MGSFLRSSNVRQRASRSFDGEVTVGLRPEAVSVEGKTAGTGERTPNTTPAVIEQLVCHRYATHLYLRMPNGEPLIAFEQNRASRDQSAIFERLFPAAFAIMARIGLGSRTKGTTLNTTASYAAPLLPSPASTGAANQADQD